MANRKLGKYDIIERLGRGGMAEVFRAYHANLDRQVAIKVLHAFLADDPEFKSRFEREAQNVGRLKHPNIVQVYDFDFDPEGESYYMVMELVEGPTLKDRLTKIGDQGKLMPQAEALKIVREAAGALAYAHSRSMIHRDVKPANLMLDHDSRVVLTDFGIAKMVTGAQFTASGGMVGTPAYMAPEQGLGEAGDERSDLYSLGVILFQLVTGQLPYDAETPLAVILKHLNAPIPSVRAINPALSEDVETVINRAIAKEASDRYQTAQDFIDDLNRLERGERVQPAPQSLPDRQVEPLASLPDNEPETFPVKTGELTRRGFSVWTWLTVLVGVVAVGILLLMASGILPGLSGTDATLTATRQPTRISANPNQVTTIPSTTQVSRPSATSAPSQTPTSVPPTTTESPMPTPATPIGQVAGQVVLRQGPGNIYAAIREVNPSDSITILGQSEDGLWFLVQQQNGIQGWLQQSVLTIAGNVAGLDVIDAPPTPTATSTITLTPTLTPTMTPSPTLTPTFTATTSPTSTVTLTRTPTATPTATRDATGTAVALTATATVSQRACDGFDYDIINRDELEDLSAVNRGLRADQEFTIVIQFLNTGDCPWPELTNLRFDIGSGENFGTDPRIFIREVVEPGEQYDLEFTGRTPVRGRVYEGRWLLETPTRDAIGLPLTITIRVFEGG